VTVAQPSLKIGVPVVDRVGAVAIAAVCLAAYVGTLSPGLPYPSFDSSELIVNASRLGLAHPSGYPIYTWCGFVFGRAVRIGTPAYRLNLMSALLGGAGIGVLYLVARRLGLVPVAAGAAALLFGLSTTFWSQAVVAEVYAPNILAVATTIWLLLRWKDAIACGRPGGTRFALFALIFGLSLGTHLSNLGFAPAYTAFVLVTDASILRRWREIVVAFGAFLAGVAQYIWVPLRATRFDVYPNPIPDTLIGLWAFTGGADSTARFAYPGWLAPGEVFLYLTLLVRNITGPGLVLGLVGMWVVLRRVPAAFWLLIGILVVNVTLFSQFAVPDRDVFFLPSFLVWALFAGFGGQALWQAMVERATRMGSVPLAAARTLVVLGVVAALVAQGLGSRATNDTTLDDFDRGELALLPYAAALVTLPGVIGSDMVYWRDIVGLRPDVTLVSRAGEPSVGPDATWFTTLVPDDGRLPGIVRRGYLAGLLPDDAWYVPVLLGGSPTMVLSRIDQRPPALVVAEAPGGRRIEQPFGPVMLVAVETTLRESAVSRRLRVQTWWRMSEPVRVVVSSRVGDATIESHVLGMGNLVRFAGEVGPVDKGLVHEDVEVVLPTTLSAGVHRVSVGVTSFGATTFVTRWMDAGDVVIG
jgi:hypothetical protein